MQNVGDGGRAFPTDGKHGGMSLRDWFAGQAIARLFKGLRQESDDADATAIAQQAYLLADALLRERSTARTHGD